MERENDELLVESIERIQTLEKLEDGPIERSDLVERLDASSATVHRIVKSLIERGLVEEVSEGVNITGLGKEVSSQVSEARERVKLAKELEPLIDLIESEGFQVRHEYVEDFVITRSNPTDPYRPVSRFIELIEKTENMKGIYRISAPPEQVNEIYDEIQNGISMEAVLEPSTVEVNAEKYPEKFKPLIQEGEMELWIDNDLPFGVSIFDERAAFSFYDEDTGILKMFADTGSPKAREWIESIYKSYREDAEKIESLDNLEV